MKIFLAILLIISALLFSGCAIFRPSPGLDITPPEKALEIRNLLSTLETKNETLKNFKGIGKIKVWQNGKILFDERVAWAGEQPVKLSIAVLISGYPAIKLASDGKWLYYLEARSHQDSFKKILASDPSLKRIILIPITSSEVIALLTGRIPMRKFNSVSLIKADSGEGYVLTLKKRWWGIQEKIYLDQNKSRVHQIEIFNQSGSLMYRAIFEKVQDVSGYQIPFRLKLTDDDGADFELDIDRYWANIAISPSTFVLTPPE
jgi:hypothetical protein